MNAPTFRIPDPQAGRAALLALDIKHATWVFADIEMPPAFRVGIRGMQVALHEREAAAP